MRRNDALIYFGLSLVLIILSLFVGEIIGEMRGYQRGLDEAEKIFLGRTE